MHRMVDVWGSLLAVFCFAIVLFDSAPAKADVVINVDRSHQRLHVSVNGVRRHSWPVSTGRAGFSTPVGVYAPQRLSRRWFSRKYYNAPMPHSIFFHGGYAIHGSTEIARLGGPASHGCVRLHPKNAATLFALVQGHGAAATTIVVSGAMPSAARRRVARSTTTDRSPRSDRDAPLPPARLSSRATDRTGTADDVGWGQWGRASAWR